MSAVTSTVTAQATHDPYHLGLSPANEAYRKQVRDTFFASATPLNTALFVLLLTVLYFRYVKPYNAQAQTLNLNKEQAIVFQTFTPRWLLKFNGVPNPLNPEGKVYLAVKGKVHDVTAGRNFYGPGGAYENFAGRDATRGLACQSFEEDMLTKDLDGPLDDCSDLGPDQLENLQGWVERFDSKVSWRLYLRQWHERTRTNSPSIWWLESWLLIMRLKYTAEWHEQVRAQIVPIRYKQCCAAQIVQAYCNIYDFSEVMLGQV